MTGEQYERMLECFIQIDGQMSALHERLNRIEKKTLLTWDAMQIILEALTPDGCGHENWEEVTTSGAPHRSYICAEPGCSEQKTEPWD